MWGVGGQQGEVKGGNGDDNKVNNRYEGYREGGTGGRAWGRGGGGLEGGGAGEVDQE